MHLNHRMRVTNVPQNTNFLTCMARTIGLECFCWCTMHARHGPHGIPPLYRVPGGIDNGPGHAQQVALSGRLVAWESCWLVLQRPHAHQLHGKHHSVHLGGQLTNIRMSVLIHGGLYCLNNYHQTPGVLWDSVKMQDLFIVSPGNYYSSVNMNGPINKNNDTFVTLYRSLLPLELTHVNQKPLI